MAGMKKKMVEGLRIESNIKVFATQDRPAEQTRSDSGQATTASTITYIPNSALAIRSSALAVLAVRQQSIYHSPAPSTCHSERESGQTTLPSPASSTEAWGICDALPPSLRRLEFPSDELEEEEQQQTLVIT